MPKINLNQIEEVEVETLPFRESRCQYITRKLGNMYDINKFDHPWSRFDKYYKLAYRILDNNINKSFDMAFHYYCTKIEQRYQKQFLKDFNGSRFNDYYIDDNGLIQLNKNVYRYKKNKPSIFYSSDYQSELVHVITKHPKTHFKEVFDYKIVLRKYGALKGTYYEKKNGYKPIYYKYVGKHYKELPKNETYIAVEEDFVVKVLQGWYKEFNSPNDPELRRLIAIRNKKEKKEKLRNKKQNKLSDQIRFDEVLRKSKDEIKQEKELDKQKMIRKGFDPLTSFKNIKNV